MNEDRSDSIEYLLRLLNYTAGPDRPQDKGDRVRWALNQAAQQLLAREGVNVGQGGNA